MRIESRNYTFFRDIYLKLKENSNLRRHSNSNNVVIKFEVCLFAILKRLKSIRHESINNCIITIAAMQIQKDAQK